MTRFIPFACSKMGKRFNSKLKGAYKKRSYHCANLMQLSCIFNVVVLKNCDGKCWYNSYTLWRCDRQVHAKLDQNYVLLKFFVL